MLKQIVLVGFAGLLAISAGNAQTSAPSSTAGGAVGTSKTGMEKPAPKAKKKAPTDSKAMRGNSSPDSTAGGAVGTSKK